MSVGKQSDVKGVEESTKKKIGDVDNENLGFEEFDSIGFQMTDGGCPIASKVPSLRNIKKSTQDNF